MQDPASVWGRILRRPGEDSVGWEILRRLRKLRRLGEDSAGRDSAASEKTAAAGRGFGRLRNLADGRENSSRRNPPAVSSRAGRLCRGRVSFLQRTYKNFFGVMVAESDDGPADQVGAHSSAAFFQDAGYDLSRGKAQVVQPGRHGRPAGDPDDLGPCPRFYIA